MSKAGCIITPGAEKDYAEIVALWKMSAAATHHFLREADFLELERDMPLKFLPSVGELWLCRRQNFLAGFCGNNGNHIEMLFIHPACMRQGLGKKLLAHAAALHGALQVEANEENYGALAFYERCGFAVTGWTSHDAQGRPYPLLHLWQIGG